MHRAPLSDITNIVPLYLGSPPRRSVSVPSSLPSAAVPMAAALPSYLELERTPTSRLERLERAACAVLVADGQPMDVVAQKVQTTPKTVRRWAQVIEDQDDLEDEYRPGRKPKLSSDQMESIVDHAIVSPITTPRQIKAEMKLDCSARTVRRVLDEAGLFGRVTRVAPPLKEEHIKKRLAFAEGYGNWTVDDWDKVLWTDEMSIRVGPQGEHWCQRLINTEWFPTHVVEKEKHAAKIHVWAAFSGKYGVEDIFTFEENLDSDLLLTILKQCLHTSSSRLKTSGQWWFQQDNDPKHKSKLIQGWLAQQGIDCIEWPPYSPDLNPIENLWANLKKRVEKSNVRTVEELKEAVVKHWQETDTELTRKLVQSMPARLNAVVQNQGCMTGY